MGFCLKRSAVMLGSAYPGSESPVLGLHRQADSPRCALAGWQCSGWHRCILVRSAHHAESRCQRRLRANQTVLSSTTQWRNAYFAPGRRGTGMACISMRWKFRGMLPYRWIMASNSMNCCARLRPGIELFACRQFTSTSHRCSMPMAPKRSPGGSADCQQRRDIAIGQVHGVDGDSSWSSASRKVRGCTRTFGYGVCSIVGTGSGAGRTDVRTHAIVHVI